MSLIHTCQLCGTNSLDYLTPAPAPRPGTGGQPRSVDAVELRQGNPAKLEYDDSILAEKDRTAAKAERRLDAHKIGLRRTGNMNTFFGQKHRALREFASEVVLRDRHLHSVVGMKSNV